MARVSDFTDDQVYHQAVHWLSLADLEDALLKGIDDFKTKPSFGVFIVLINPLVTLAAFLVVFN